MQRTILEVVGAAGVDETGRPVMVPASELVAAVYDAPTNPTRSQIEAVRRAVFALAAAGLVHKFGHGTTLEASAPLTEQQKAEDERKWVDLINRLR